MLTKPRGGPNWLLFHRRKPQGVIWHQVLTDSWLVNHLEQRVIHRAIDILLHGLFHCLVLTPASPGLIELRCHFSEITGSKPGLEYLGDTIAPLVTIAFFSEIQS